MTASDDAAFIRTWYRDCGYLYLIGIGVANLLPDMLRELDRSARFVGITSAAHLRRWPSVVSCRAVNNAKSRMMLG